MEKIETLLLEKNNNESMDLDKNVLMVYYVNLQYESFHSYVQMPND